MLHVRAAGVLDAAIAKTFSAWLIPGRKRIAHAGKELVITAMHGPHCLRASVCAALKDGASCDLMVPFDASLRSRLSAHQVQARVLAGEMPQPSPRLATRSALLHLRALQALDAKQAGAPHRDIAGALFGPDEVQSRWNADSELRAQVRHVLTRAEEFMRGGYRALAGIRLQPIHAPGDEPEH